MFFNTENVWVTVACDIQDVHLKVMHSEYSERTLNEFTNAYAEEVRGGGEC